MSIFCQKTKLDFKDSPSRTKQSFRDECNINTIVKKAKRTGLLPTKGLADFGDFSDGIDFMEAKIRIVQAEQAFLNLSSDLRARFDNDPAKLIGFLADEKNRDEAVKLKLLNAPILEQKPADISQEQTP